jgi:hypothetical protein
VEDEDALLNSICSSPLLSRVEFNSSFKFSDCMQRVFCAKFAASRVQLSEDVDRFEGAVAGGVYA